MKLFKCQACQQILYFENTVCVKSQHRLGFIPDTATLTALAPDRDRWRTVAAAGGLYKFCANAEHAACNWLIEAASPETLCVSCRDNRMIPDLTIASNLEHWQKIEIAKHRLFYSLLRLKLPTPTRGQEPVFRASFRFLGRAPAV